MNRRSLRRALIAVGVCSALVICGSALALAKAKGDSGNPFASISSANQAVIGASAVDAQTKSLIEMMTARERGPLGEQNIAEARTLGSTIGGRNVYLIPSTAGDLCVAVTGFGDGCILGSLSRAEAAIFGVVDPDGPGGVGATVYGVAMDGVQSISFDISGTPEQAAVTRNVFEFQAGSAVTTDDVSAPTANFADGTSVRLP